MSANTDTRLSAFDGGTLSPAEESALSFLRDAVAGMRASKAAPNVPLVERAIAAAGGSRVGGGGDAFLATFVLHGARFTVRAMEGPGERVEVSFIGGDSC